MTLRLITGQANAGKTGRVYELVRSRVGGGESGIVVLPTIPDVLRARSELSHDIPLGLQILTFHGLITALWSQWGDGRPIVGDVKRDLVFAALARERGQSRAMGRLAASCAVQLAETTGEAWRTHEPAAAGPGQALSGLLGEYAGYLSRTALIEPAEAARWLGELREPITDLLAVHRFSDFTPSQVALLRGAGEACDVMVSATWEEGFRPTAALGPLVEELAPPHRRELADEPPHYTHPTLERLGKALFSEPSRLPDDQAVRFVLAQGGEAEARQIADEILLARGHGSASALDRIAVAFRDPARHASQLRYVLEEAGIPADFDTPTPFAQVPFGAAFLDLLSFAITGDRAPLLNLLRSPFSGIESGTVRDLEERLRRRGTKAASSLVAEVGSADRRLQALIQDSRRAAAKPLTISSCQGLATAARRLFSVAHEAREAPGCPNPELDARAHAKVMALLSEVAAMEGVSVRLADVSDALAATEITPSGLERPGRVQVMPLTRLRGRRFETVIVAGMNAGEFPAASPETTLSGSAVDAVLRQFGGGSYESGGPAFEQLLLYEAVTRAKNRLVLGAQAADHDGEAQQLSPLLELVADFFRDAGEDESLPVHSFRRIGETTREEGGGSPREVLREAARTEDESGARIAAARRRRRYRPGTLTDPAQTVGLDSATVLSASQIQAYVRCPYRWFYEYLLAPRELEREFDVREEGEFAHLLLANVYESLIRSGEARLGPEGLDGAIELLGSVYEDQAAQQGAPRSLDEQVGRRHALHWARRVLVEDADRADDFVPALIEWKFGYDADPIDMGGYLLRGRIDRIDVDRDGRAVVIDYKRTCSTSHGANKMLSEGLVQIPLYLEAVKRGALLQPIAGVYRGLASAVERGLVTKDTLDGARTTSTDIREPEEFEALVAEALELCARAVERMRAGDIAPRPRTSGSCVRCPIAAVCGARL